MRRGISQQLEVRFTPDTKFSVTGADEFCLFRQIYVFSFLIYQPYSPIAPVQDEVFPPVATQFTVYTIAGYCEEKWPVAIHNHITKNCNTILLPETEWSFSRKPQGGFKCVEVLEQILWDTFYILGLCLWYAMTYCKGAQQSHLETASLFLLGYQSNGLINSLVIDVNFH